MKVWKIKKRRKNQNPKKIKGQKKMQQLKKPLSKLLCTR